eukprot:6214818-Pleurochrysis_carterae.AAC.6
MGIVIKQKGDRELQYWRSFETALKRVHTLVPTTPAGRRDVVRRGALMKNKRTKTSQQRNYSNDQKVFAFKA